MDRFFSLIHENWDVLDHPTMLPAYALWRLNWIHPFVEGNGRTARAACYYLICMRQGRLLPGRKIVPERIGRIESHIMRRFGKQIATGTRATSMSPIWQVTLKDSCGPAGRNGLN